MSKDYANSDMAWAIDEYVHNEVHREILKRKLIDKRTYQELEEEFSYDSTHIERIVRKHKAKLFRILEKTDKLIEI